MAEFKGNDRRRVQRTKLITFCPTTVHYQGHEIKAIMQDVSPLGAGLKLRECPPDVELVRNEIVSLDVKTPYGMSHCSGRIAWSRVTDGVCSCGLEFTSLSDDPSDPLRCLMDSPF